MNAENRACKDEGEQSRKSGLAKQKRSVVKGRKECGWEEG